MNTELLNDASAIDRAVDWLNRDQVVALPTETVYGLAGKARSPDAVSRIFAAKERPTSHPLIVHLARADQVPHWAIDLPDHWETLAEAFWPGPLTLVLKRHPSVPDAVSAGMDTIALRVPAHPVFRAVLAAVNTGLAAPSANRYKRLSPTTAEQALAGLDGRIAAVLDGGPCAVGIESTILDLTGDTPRVLRAGPITAGTLAETLGRPVEHPDRHDVVAPGNVSAHYRPQTPLRLVPTEALFEGRAEPGTVYMVWSEHAPNRLLDARVPPASIRVMPPDPEGYARELYGTLFQIDRSGANHLRVETPPDGEAWRGILDRLSRAQR